MLHVQVPEGFPLTPCTDTHPTDNLGGGGEGGNATLKCTSSSPIFCIRFCQRILTIKPNDRSLGRGSWVSAGMLAGKWCGGRVFKSNQLHRLLAWHWLEKDIKR
jgi:hypothetical protein